MISNPKNAFSASGAVLANINEAGLLVANASTLRHEEQVQYDTALVQIARKRLRMANLLRGKGLVRPLGGLGTILSLYEQAGDFTAAKVSMSGRTSADQDTLTFDEVGVPIPIFHKEFELDARRLAASRNGVGQPLDTSSIEIATRIVADEFESHIYNGAPQISVGGSTVYGLCTSPFRNTGSITGGWATGANVITDVKAMLQALYDDNFFGPFTLVVPKNYWAGIQLDYSDVKGDNTIMDRIMAFVDISEVIPGDYLTNSNVVMFNADSETIDLAIGQDMSNIPWQAQPLSTEFKVFMAGAVRVKADKNGRCGVVHLS
jgi:uncharacterized linocin/CFP29 family protein